MGNRACSDVEVAQFSLRMQQLLDAGIPILRALSLLKFTWNKSQLVRYRELEEHLSSGNSLAQALRLIRYPSFFCSLIAFSEQHGQLVETFALTYDFYQKRYKRKRQLRKMITYPLFVLASSVLTMLLIFYYLLPQFASLYETMGVSLPPLVRLSLHWTNAGPWIHWFAFLNIVLIMLVCFYFYRFKRVSMAGYLLQVPYISLIIKFHLNGLISTQLGLLLEGGIPILEICRLFREESHSQLISNMFQIIDRELRKGKPLSASLGQIRWALPVLHEMVAVGEHSGMLGPTLKRLGEQLDHDLDHLITRTAGYVENLLLVGTGAVVMLLLFTLFSPMLSIVDQL
jgi:type II secretory pathway component PulF